MKQTKFYLGLLVFCAFFLLNAKSNVIATLEYFYAKDGTIIGRSINGVMQDYSYDKKGQLLSVSNSKTGQKVEEYAYDPAGNILRKTVNGKTTVYTYDDANQLMTSTKDGKVTTYEYDAAGRMIQEGAKTYSYGYLDKVMSVQENGADIASFTYHADGQISSANTKIGKETFLWDGLALIGRDATQYVNEPYVTGGNPILANDKVLFNDILGTTLGVNSDKYAAIPRDAFGMTAQSGKDEFFTGKPYIGELGYAFLFRNYRAEQGKWQTQDPIAIIQTLTKKQSQQTPFAKFGYPDGWNNLAYGNNAVFSGIDYQGTIWRLVGVTDTRHISYNTDPVLHELTAAGNNEYISKYYIYQYTLNDYRTAMIENVSLIEVEYYAGTFRHYQSVDIYTRGETFLRTEIRNDQTSEVGATVTRRYTWIE